jgi:DNA-binding NarL/FixJ family response regulator
MPGMTGIEVIQRLHTDGIAVAAVLLTTFDDPEQAIDGIRAGARGYLLKDVSRSQLQEAIEIVAGGGSLVQPAVTERVLRGLSNLGKKFDGGAGQEPLSGRERGVLRLVAGGFSNREIAKALDLSEGTVKNHVSNVLTKLGVRDRTRAVLKAADLGWL